jgi:2,3,4,5-tetrahydropyridine-2-carboxylate N-succinyltransferase
MTTQLREQITELVDQSPEAIDKQHARRVFETFIDALDTGRIRAAEQDGDGWKVNRWVKKGILLGFRLGEITDMSNGAMPFFDKDTYPVKSLSAKDEVRLVPGGSSIRRGAYTAPGVICMPPMFINVGGYVDEGTMVDSHALVGSCAQIGKRVHLSAAAQTGGVLEPVGALPVIIEDDAFVGGGCGVYEGCLVREGAVLASGVTLTSSTRVYDLPNERTIQSEGGVLEIPSYAVVVPGSRPVDGTFAREHGLSVDTPIIVKYRDASTDAATSLEGALR